MITWEPSEKTPGTTHGRVGKVLFFKINLDYNYKRVLSARTFSTIATSDRTQSMWARVGYFPSEEEAKKAAEEQWPVFLKRLGLVQEADFIDYIGEGAQAAIVEAITTAAQDAAAYASGELSRLPDPEEVFDPDGWAAEAIETAINKLIERGILPPEKEG